MDDRDEEAVSQFISTLSEWKSDSLLCSVEMPGDPAVSMEFNASSGIGKVALRSHSATRHYIVFDPPPPERKQENSKHFRVNFLSPFIQRMGKRDGCKLVLHDKTRDGKGVIVRCARHRIHHPKPKQADKESSANPQKRVCKTMRPLQAEDRCPFHFSVYFDEEVQKWYLNSECPGNPSHVGHARKLEAEVKLGSNAIGLENLKDVETWLGAHVDVDVIRAVVEKKTTIQLTTAQIKGLRLKFEIQQNPGSGSATPADSLISMLESDPDISCAFLMAEFDSDLLSIPKIYQRRRCYNTTQLETTPITGDSLNDGADSAAQVALNIRQSLQITGTSKILLAACWVERSGARNFRMFPEFVSVDGTMKVCAEERMLNVLSGKDGNNQTFSSCAAFMPSKGLWAQNWFHNVAIPAIIDQKTREKVYIILADEDLQQAAAIDAACGGVAVTWSAAAGPVRKKAAPDKPYANGIRRGCNFHLFNRNLTSQAAFKSLYSQLKGDNRLEWDRCLSFMKAFTTYIESEAEGKLYVAMFSDYLAHSNTKERLGEALVQRTRDFFMRSMLPRKHHYFRYYFRGVRYFREKTSSVSEIENAKIKSGNTKVQPNLPLHKSAARYNATHRISHQKKDVIHAAAMDATVTDSTLIGVKGLTPYGQQRTMAAYDERTRYEVFRLKEHVYLVKAKQSSSSHDETRHLPGSILPIPRFQRTRTVTLSIVEGRPYAKCSCCGYEELGWPCGHLYRVIGEAPPSKSDVDLRFWQEYLTYYLKNDRFTDLFDEMRAKPYHGVFCRDDALVSLEIGHGTRERDFFTASLDKLTLYATPEYISEATRQRLGAPIATHSTLPCGLSREGPPDAQDLEAMGFERIFMDAELRLSYMKAPSRQVGTEVCDCDSNPPAFDDSDSVSPPLGDDSDNYSVIMEELQHTSVLSDDILSSRMARGETAHTLLGPLWEECTRLAKKLEQVQIFQRHLQNARTELLASHAQGLTSSVRALEGTASLPVRDRSTSNRRFRKQTSPKKRQKRKGVR